MARRTGHEDCPTCLACGLPYCPDCDEKARSCTCSEFGASVVEYALMTAMVLVILGVMLVAMGSLTEAMLQVPGQMQPTVVVTVSSGGGR